MATALQSAGSTLQRGWRWWTGELAEMLPGASSASRPSPPGLVVSAETSGLRLIDERTRFRRKAARDLTGDDALSALEVDARSRSPAPVRLRLPHSQCFVRRVEVPAALRAEAKRFLDLDLERATPFRLKDVYTAHYFDEARPRRGMLGVTQLVVRREAVDRKAAEVRSTGAQLAAIDVWNAEGTAALPVDFQAREADEVASGGAQRLGRGLAALVAALAASAAYLALSRHESALAELTQQTADARVRATAVRQAMESSQSALRQARAISELRTARPLAVEVLDRLTALLPDGVWITDLRIDGNAIQFSGEAEAAAPLVALVEDSAMFSDAAFTAPVTRESGQQKERFSMRARIGDSPAAGTPPDGEPSP